MHDYEITIITNAELAEDARTQLDGAVDDQIGQLDGTISYNSPHTPKRLFFPIKKINSASIRTIQIELEPDKINALHTFLKKASNILRFSILQTPRRQEVDPSILEQLTQKKSTKPAASSPAGQAKTPAKPISDEAVEAGIEKALSEEVK